MLEALVVREKYDAHAASPQEAIDPVPAVDDGTGGERNRAHLGLGPVALAGRRIGDRSSRHRGRLGTVGNLCRNQARVMTRCAVSGGERLGARRTESAAVWGGAAARWTRHEQIVSARNSSATCLLFPTPLLGCQPETEDEEHDADTSERIAALHQTNGHEDDAQNDPDGVDASWLHWTRASLAQVQP
jgi:hypothetical protein